GTIGTDGKVKHCPSMPMLERPYFSAGNLQEVYCLITADGCQNGAIATKFNQFVSSVRNSANAISRTYVPSSDGVSKIGGDQESPIRSKTYSTNAVFKITRQYALRPRLNVE